MTALIKRLTLVEALGLSLAIVAPTVTAAFNITLVVGAAGRAAPLAFLIAAVATGLVALSFMAFAHRVAHAGSAYAYITHTFGPRVGFVAGWALYLSYLMFGTSFAALVGSFSVAALRTLGLSPPEPAWLGIGLLALLIAWALAHRDMRLAGRVMLAIEGIAILAIVGLCVAILRQVHPSAHTVVTTLTPSAEFDGWKGLGFGMVFSVLSFSGFEGATTLGEEAVNPRRAIPVAVLGSVLLCAVFYTVVSFCEVIGFGMDHLHQLATAEAPLDLLSKQYASSGLSIALDLAAATTCFSGTIGAIAAGGRILYALGRAGLATRLAAVHPTHGTPATAIAVTAVLNILPFLIAGPFIGPGNYYSYTSTIAVLALMLDYIGVGVAEVVEARHERRYGWAALCALGPILLAWVLFRNVYPIPDWPNNWWPYVTLAWIAFAWPLLRWRPSLGRAPLPDYF
jgi:amino acid transporter